MILVTGHYNCANNTSYEYTDDFKHNNAARIKMDLDPTSCSTFRARIWNKGQRAKLEISEVPAFSLVLMSCGYSGGSLMIFHTRIQL
jgi:hypothetical protein